MCASRGGGVGSPWSLHAVVIYSIGIAREQAYEGIMGSGLVREEDVRQPCTEE
jgi:hypothetical protein